LSCEIFCPITGTYTESIVFKLRYWGMVYLGSSLELNNPHISLCIVAVPWIFCPRHLLSIPNHTVYQFFLVWKIWHLAHFFIVKFPLMENPCVKVLVTMLCRICRWPYLAWNWVISLKLITQQCW
jgi:hypothetical protein